MDIYTDASLNDKKKIAGVSAIFVPPQASGPVTSYNAYCSVSKIETAELFAIAMALSLLKPRANENVRVISDSKGALKKIQRIFHHPDQRQMKTIKDSMQRKIMYNMSLSFSKNLDMNLTFCCIHGHQHKVQAASDAYYNAIADQEALVGRMNGEILLQQDKEHHMGISILSAEERIILNQLECDIVSPGQISFSYDDLKTGTKIRRHPKNLSVRSAYKQARTR